MRVLYFAFRIVLPNFFNLTYFKQLYIQPPTPTSETLLRFYMTYFVRAVSVLISEVQIFHEGYLLLNVLVYVANAKCILYSHVKNRCF